MTFEEIDKIIRDPRVRKGCKDIFQSFMVKNAIFTGDFDIPYCPTTASIIPQNIIPYSETKKGRSTDCFVHFYQDDQKFDGPSGIWRRPYQALKRLANYSGVITPDFSTYQDMPVALKIYNTYRMRAFGYWLGVHGIPVINNVRWGTEESFSYCLDGIPQDSIISIGSLGCLKGKTNYERFKNGLAYVISRLHPHTVLVYGSAPSDIFDQYRSIGIKIISYPAQIALAFMRQKEGV